MRAMRVVSLVLVITLILAASLPPQVAAGQGAEFVPVQPARSTLQATRHYELALAQIQRARTAAELAAARAAVAQAWPAMQEAGQAARATLAGSGQWERLGELDRRLAAAEAAHAQLAQMESPDPTAVAHLLPQLRTGGGSARPAPAVPLPGQSAIPPLPIGQAQPLAEEQWLRAADAAWALPQLPGNLASSEDAQITPEIEALADQLLDDPAAIYAYVLNNIEYEPYYGSRKGSQLTLWERSGNDADTASLLVALLRASGHPAQYVHGTIAISAAQARNWAGNAPDLQTAAAIFAAGGVPVRSAGSSQLHVNHIWVALTTPAPVTGTALYLPWVARPAGAAAADAPSPDLLTPPPADWVMLDASYKQFTYFAPVADPADVIGFDPATLMVEARAGTRLDDGKRLVYSLPRVVTGGAANGDRPLADAYIGEAAAAAEAFAAANREAALGDLMGGRAIVKKTVSKLPTALPYPVVDPASVVTYSELPARLRHYLEIEIVRGDGNTDLSYRAGVAALGNRRITIAYAAASPADQSVIDDHGGLLIKTPPEVALVPVLRVGGTEVRRGDAGQAQGMGEFQRWQLTFERPGGQQTVVSNTLVVGDMAAVVLDVGRTSAQAVGASAGRLAAARAALPKDSKGYPDANAAGNLGEPVMGELLNLVGQAYFGQWDAHAEMVARGLGVRWLRHLSGGVVTQPLVIEYFFGVPVNTLGGGLGIDMPNNAVAAVALEGDPDAETAFRWTMGFTGSSIEEEVWRMAGQRAVSTVGLLARALAHGIPVHTIDASNQEQIADLLLMGSDLTIVEQAVAAGMTVIVPEEPAIPGWTGGIGDWAGTGYVIADAESGAASFVISGGLSEASLTQGGSIADILKSAVPYVFLMLGMLACFGLMFTALDLIFLPANAGIGSVLWLAAKIAYKTFSVASNLGKFIKFSNMPEGARFKYLGDQLAALLARGLHKNAANDSAAGAVGQMTTQQRQAYVDQLDRVTGGLAPALLERGISQEEVIALALASTNLGDWQAVGNYADEYGVELAQQLLDNSYVTGEGALGKVAQISLAAPAAAGRRQVVAAAAVERGFGNAYALQAAAAAQAAGETVVQYRPQKLVTYRSVVGFDGQGQPIFGEDEQGTLRASYATQSPPIWYNVTHGPCLGDRNLPRWNQIMMANAAGGSADLFIYMFVFSQRSCPGTEAWVLQNCSWVTFLTQQGNSLP